MLGRRFFHAARLCRALLIAANVAFAATPVEAAVRWGVNGHPLTAYAGITADDQIGLLADLGLTYYRVDVTNVDQIERLDALISAARKRNVKILPLLIPPVDLAKGSPDEIYTISRDFAQIFVRRFGSEIAVWELGNELENFAIIQPCELRDDGTKYPCEWGPAGGMTPLEYVGERYRKVAAVIRGLSDGVRAVSATAQRAIGSAGWGHLGVFDRFFQDAIGWEISVWHLYSDNPEPAFKKLASFGKPIWVTEFNHPFGSSKEGEDKQAEGLLATMKRLSDLSDQYKVEAAMIYELLDETYWAPNFEASMGLVQLEAAGQGWRLGPQKAAYRAVRELAKPGAP